MHITNTPEKSPKKVSTWFDIQKSFHQLIEVEDEQLAKNNNNNNILVSELPGQNSRRRRMMDESFGPAKNVFRFKEKRTKKLLGLSDVGGTHTNTKKWP
jgi:hypothetical protein